MLTIRQLFIYSFYNQSYTLVLRKKTGNLIKALKLPKKIIRRPMRQTQKIDAISRLQTVP